MSGNRVFRPSGRHLAIVGPTTSGKSAIALAIAESRNDIEIVTVDSMQVYRGMDIGTAKPTAEEQSRVRHHLLDVCDPHDDYTVSRFQADCLAVLESIEGRGHRALLVGGTGLYLQSVTDDLDIPGQFPEVRVELEAQPDTAGLFDRLFVLDPLASTRMEPTNRRRIVRALEVTIGAGRPFSSFGPGIDVHLQSPFPIVGLSVDRSTLDAGIKVRYQQQLADGFVAEVSRLLANPNGIGRAARQALGYAEILVHLETGRPLNEMITEANTRTRRFARRQQRWFARDPRITWIGVDKNDFNKVVNEVACGLVD